MTFNFIEFGIDRVKGVIGVIPQITEDNIAVFFFVLGYSNNSPGFLF